MMWEPFNEYLITCPNFDCLTAFAATCQNFSLYLKLKLSAQRETLL